jgi:hypothetical protein
MEIADNSIRKIEDFADGSSVYEIGAKLPDVNNEDFDHNIALSMSEASLKKLSNFLLDAIKEDIEARKEWLTTVEKIKKYLGFNLEDLHDIPFKESTRTFDTTLATALIRFYATARAEFLPKSGPAGFEIKNGDEENSELEKLGEKRRNKLNNYLTITDKGFYSDYEKFLLYLGLYGSAARKVYYDTVLDRHISRFILPVDFIVNGDCTSILESTRITHVLHLSKREIILNQQAGVYRDVELKHLKMSDSSEDDNDEDNIKTGDGIDLSVYSKRSLSPIYEIHTYIDLEEFADLAIDNSKNNVPLPYVIAIDKISSEILYIRKNWNADDPKQQANIYFEHYNYFPGFGIYGIGLAHLIGSNAISLTTILRELIDAGKFKNLPGGLRAKGFGQQKNDIIVGPGEWPEIDTGGLPLQQGLMPLPYSEPSQTLRELRLELMDQTKELGSTSEMGMMDSREDIPVGTAMAFLEVNNRLQSAVFHSIHKSLSRELQLLDKFLNADDQGVEGIQIIPVSDPTTNSTVQRIMKARATLELAMQAPELHYMPAVFRLNYDAQGLDQKEIDKILKPDPETMEEEALPLDPISENINARLGKPLKVAVWQAHPAHILIHGLEAQDNPDLAPVLMEHITNHQAQQYLIDMQQLLGFELPPLEELQDPQVQNSIAMALAEKLGNRASEQQESPAPIDPNALLMADIQQKEADTAARERIANMKAETDVFKAQLDFEKEKAKIESNEDIAKLKSETELTKQEYSNG